MYEIGSPTLPTCIRRETERETSDARCRNGCEATREGQRQEQTHDDKEFRIPEFRSPGTCPESVSHGNIMNGWSDRYFPGPNSVYIAHRYMRQDGSLFYYITNTLLPEILPSRSASSCIFVLMKQGQF